MAHIIILQPNQVPDTWNLPEIFGTAIALGSYLSVSTIILYILAVDTSVFHDWFGVDRLSKDEARGLIYLQVWPPDALITLLLPPVSPSLQRLSALTL